MQQESRNKLTQEKKTLCKEYMIYILSNNYIIKKKRKKKEKNPKKIIMIYAPWQMLFKSISSATYVSLRIALKKIVRKIKEKKRKEENQLQKVKNN